MSFWKKLFGARKVQPSKAQSSKVTVHFFYGLKEPLDTTPLKPLVRGISKQEDLPDSSLFFYNVHPWPQAVKEHGLKVIRDAGRYPQGNVAVFDSLGELTGTLEGVPFACLTLIAGFGIKTVKAEDLPEEVRKQLGL